jgi:hypothetical protein
MSLIVRGFKCSDPLNSMWISTNDRSWLLSGNNGSIGMSNAPARPTTNIQTAALGLADNRIDWHCQVTVV